MAQVAYFWIANMIYLSFVLATLTSSALKIVAYRRGFEAGGSLQYPAAQEKS